METITPEEKKVMQSFMTDFWNLVKETYHIPRTTETALDAVDRLCGLARKYQDEDTKQIPPAITRILTGWASYLDYEGCGRERDYIDAERGYIEILSGRDMYVEQ